MSVFRSFVSVTLNNGKNGFKTMGKSPCRLLACAPAMLSIHRNAHSQDLTKNIQYISNDKLKLTANPDTMRLDNDTEKPLCVMINWMLAKHKHVMKYATLYLEQGFDVLSVSCTPWQLLWPTKGSQLVAAELLNFMANNSQFRPLMLHGFSVGGYMWGELCMHAAADKERYQPVLDRVVAQVWDSAADISEISIGVPAAVFPKNKIMQRTLQTYMEYHMKTFHESATVHYMRSSQMFHRTPCRAPALFILSKSDPVGAEDSNRRVLESWEAQGMKCTWKIFDRSPHVQHFNKHPREYVAAIASHLAATGLLRDSARMVAQ